MPNFVQTDVNYATAYGRDVIGIYPYLSYFADIWASENSARYRDMGGKNIAIPSLEVSGARMVNRDYINGVFTRNWNNDWQIVSMRMDRDWGTLIDPMDILESK